MSSVLLPGNATPWEKAVADAAIPTASVEGAITAIRGVKLDHPVPAMLPYIIWEYGLGELSPYVPNLYELIEEGIEWQRVRGTPLALAKGLSWLGYAAGLEEAPVARKYWNSFQLRFTTLPANDDPLLSGLAGVAQLSVPERSKFRRGVYQYDVPVFELDRSRLDNGMLDHESGISYPNVEGIWSFGRTHETEHVLTEEEGTEAGNWIDPDLYEIPSILLDFDDDEYSIGGDSLTRSEFEAAYFTRDGEADTLTMTADGAVFDGDVDESIILSLADAQVPESMGTVIWRGEITATVDGEWSRVFEIGDDTTKNLISVFVSASGKLTVNMTRDWSYLGGATTEINPIGNGPQTVGVTWQGSNVRIRINNDAAVTGSDALLLERDDERPYFGDTVSDTIVKQIVVFNRFLTTNEFDEVMDSIATGDIHGPAIESGAGFRWVDLDIPWEDADFPWLSDALTARAAALAAWYQPRCGHFALRNAEGALIGYRRARAAHISAQDLSGRYRVGDTLYSPASGGTVVYFEAMTDFGMETDDVASISLVVGGTRASGVKPGKLWLSPDELTGGVEIGAFAVDFPLRSTVREQIKFLLRF